MKTCCGCARGERLIPAYKGATCEETTRVVCVDCAEDGCCAACQCGVEYSSTSGRPFRVGTEE